MRNQYKVLAEKYSIVKETSEDDQLNLGMFGMDLWDTIKNYPDKHGFIRWLITTLPSERLPAAKDNKPYALPPYSRDIHGINDWLGDRVKIFMKVHDISTNNTFTGQMRAGQQIMNAEYRVFEVYKKNLNKDNPGVPSDY